MNQHLTSELFSHGTALLFTFKICRYALRLQSNLTWLATAADGTHVTVYQSNLISKLPCLTYLAESERCDSAYHGATSTCGFRINRAYTTALCRLTFHISQGNCKEVHRYRYLRGARFRRITPKFCSYPYTRRFEHKPTWTRICNSEYDTTFPICHSRQLATWHDLTYAAIGEPRAQRFHSDRFGHKFRWI